MENKNEFKSESIEQEQKEKINNQIEFSEEIEEHIGNNKVINILKNIENNTKIIKYCLIFFAIIEIVSIIIRLILINNLPTIIKMFVEGLFK